MTKVKIATERARLNRLLATRDGKGGYQKNVAAIKAALASLDKETASDG